MPGTDDREGRQEALIQPGLILESDLSLHSVLQMIDLVRGRRRGLRRLGKVLA